MIEINPDKIKKAEIAVGIPSYNERDTISNVVKQVDKGLVKYFKNKSAVIINSDNNSLDKTKEVFLKTGTKTPKIYISTPKNIRGKGNNLRNLFLKIKDLKTEASINVDADLKSITPEWIKCLIAPIFKGYDYLTPIYLRHKRDASITNRLCYPLVYGLLGYDIRQPIGGDMGFSKKMVKYWLNQKWPDEVKGYGIDMFMTLYAVKSGFKLGQVYLGSKVHKPSAPKLDKMFLEVAETIFQFLAGNKGLWQRKIKLKKIPLVCNVKRKAGYPKTTFDVKRVEKEISQSFENHYRPIKSHISEDVSFQLERIFFKEKSLKIDNELWIKIVYQLFFIYQTSLKKETLIKLLRVLYFARTISFIEETFNRNQKEAEKIIQDQAHHFFKTRNYLFSLIS